VNGKEGRVVPTGLRAVAWPDGVLRAHRPGPDARAPLARAGRSADREPWEIRNAAGDGGGAAELWLYEEIGGWGIWAEDVAGALARISASQITVRVNSPGGDVFDGIAIMNALIAHPAKVTVMVDGLAASIASVITLAGDKVVMGHSAQMMIHNASTLTWGEAGDLRKTADLLDQVSGVIAQAYADRCGTPVEEWAARMNAETWLTAQDCVRLGLADEVAALPSRGDGAEAGVDPDPDNQATARPAAEPPVTLRPAARLEDAGTDTGDISVPVDASTGSASTPVDGVVDEVPVTNPDGDQPDEGSATADAAGGVDVPLVGQIMGWALAVDQHVDRLIAECALALGVDNPDVDNDGDPPPLPPGPAGIAYALGILTAIDTVVDGGQVVLAEALGICNPDPDADTDEPDGPDMHAEPLVPAPAAPVDDALPAPTDSPDAGAEPVHDTWAGLTAQFTTPTLPDPDDPFAGLRGAWT